MRVCQCRVCVVALRRFPSSQNGNRAPGRADAAPRRRDTYADQELKRRPTRAQSHDAVAQREYRLALSRALDANERALQAAKADDARSARGAKPKARSPPPPPG